MWGQVTGYEHGNRIASDKSAQQNQSSFMLCFHEWCNLITFVFSQLDRTAFCPPRVDDKSASVDGFRAMTGLPSDGKVSPKCGFIVMSDAV